MAVSLRVPEEVKKRIAKLAKQQDLTPHGFMLDAIREKVEVEEVRLAFHAEAERRLARMKKSGVGIPAEEVFEYLQKRAAGRKATRPKPRKLSHRCSRIILSPTGSYGAISRSLPWVSASVSATASSRNCLRTALQSCQRGWRRL